MTMFGRDSILTSLQALPFVPELAATTLRVLATWQGSRLRRLPRRGPGADPARAAVRRVDGVRGAAARRRTSATADATPLFVVLLDEYERWTGDGAPGARVRVRGAGGAALDRRVRRPDGQRVRVVPAAQRGDRPGEPVLEGLLGLHLLPRRPAARLPARNLRAAGLRLRREAARRPAGPRVLGRPGATPTGWSARRPS